MDTLCIGLNRPGGDSLVKTNKCPPPPPPPPNPQVVRLLTVPVTTQLFCVSVFSLEVQHSIRSHLNVAPGSVYKLFCCQCTAIHRLAGTNLLVASGGSNLEKKVCSRQSRRRSETDCLFWPRSSHHFFPLFQSKVYISAKQGMLGRGKGPTKHGQNTIIM
jgi:hypothetical protein